MLINICARPIVFVLLLFAALCGCVRPPAAVTDRKAAYQKFRDICDEELQSAQLRPDGRPIVPALFPLEDTLYIYVPISFDLLAMKADTQPQPPSPANAEKKRQLNFFETTFANQTITIHFDISLTPQYQKSPGYVSSYSDEFSKLHNSLLTAIDRSFGDLNEDQPPPVFVVLYIVHVHDGVGVKNTFHYSDLKQYLQQTLPQEEYVKRYMTEMIGDRQFIENATGRNLNFRNITWPEFIAQQITYRANFKYTRSSFPPTDSDINEILAIVNDTVHAYDFGDFEAVRLKNLATGETSLIKKDQLETFGTFN